MRSWVLAASLLAVAAGTGAQAADLYDGPPPPDRYGSAYEDPRYADIYRYPGPGPAPYAVPPPPRPYLGPYAGPPIPREGIYRDDYGYDRGYYDGPRRPYAGHCLPREAVKDRLLGQGWHDFHGGDVQGDIATVRARRPSGEIFVLAIERCTGEIVSAQPLGPPRFGPYAYGPPPRRWDRPY